MNSPKLLPLPPEVRKIFEAVAELEQNYPGRRFTPDGHMMGSIGEVIAASAFDLRLLQMSAPGHDAKDPEGRDVQIKLTAGDRVSMYATCDRLLVMRITSDKLHAEVVYDGDGAPVWQAAGAMQKNGQRPISISKLRMMSNIPSESETNPAIERMTDGFVVWSGDKVLWDGEAVIHGYKPMTEVPKHWGINDGWSEDTDTTS
jgi:hypothetical protein